jgi:hypothetical protein
LSALKVVDNPGFPLWETCGKGRQDFRPEFSTVPSTGYQQLFNSLFEQNVDKSNIDSLAPPQDEFLPGNILQRAISVCALVYCLPSC